MKFPLQSTHRTQNGAILESEKKMFFFLWARIYIIGKENLTLSAMGS